MKDLKDFVLLFEAPASRYEKVIGGIYRFNVNVTNDEIIETVLRDFSLKCANLIKDYYRPEVGLSSLCTYEIFTNRWSIDNPGDITAKEDAEKIYGEIPSDICAQYISEIEGINMSIDDIKRMFDGGEFPLIQIWKGYHKGRDEIHVTYVISR